VNSIDLLMSDETGRARIDSHALRITVTTETRHTPSKRMREILARHSMSSEPVAFVRTFNEGIIAAGDEVAVIGRVSLEHDPDLVNPGFGYRDRPKRVVISAPPRGFVLVSHDL
jgi:hypothetical protein